MVIGYQNSILITMNTCYVRYYCFQSTTVGSPVSHPADQIRRFLETDTPWTPFSGKTIQKMLDNFIKIKASLFKKILELLCTMYIIY